MDLVEEILLWIKGEEKDKPLKRLYTEEELKELERDRGLDKFK
jgi:hypothetical protein